MPWSPINVPMAPFGYVLWVSGTMQHLLIMQYSVSKLYLLTQKLSASIAVSIYNYAMLKHYAVYIRETSVQLSLQPVVISSVANKSLACGQSWQCSRWLWSLAYCSLQLVKDNWDKSDNLSTVPQRHP